MQYRVPQNIDREDKLLGPMTFTQFVYALIGGSFLLIMFATLPFFLFAILGIPVLLFTIALALVKVQDQPFTHFLMAFLVYLKQPKHRIWHDLTNPPQSDGLGTDFMEDVARDNPPVAGKNQAQSTASKIDPFDAIAGNQAATNATTNAGSDLIPVKEIAPSQGQTMPVQPAKQAKMLTIQVEKGGV